MGFVVRMNASSSPDADVFAEAHVSEGLAVNQSWDVTSDGCLCLMASSALKRNSTHFGCLFLIK